MAATDNIEFRGIAFDRLASLASDHGALATKVMDETMQHQHDDERPQPQDDPDEAPDLPTDEPTPAPVQDPPAEPDRAPYVVRYEVRARHGHIGKSSVALQTFEERQNGRDAAAPFDDA